METKDSAVNGSVISPPMRVLIADDAQEARRGTRLMLSMNESVRVVAFAQDGQQAVQLARAHKPDIAIIDINMPNMNGIQAIRSILSEQPDIVCIVISAERDSQTLRDAMAAGAREYLIKPYTVDEIDLAVERVSRLVQQKRQRIQEVQQLNREREEYLRNLADEYVKARRTDDQAIKVLERLAANPNCEKRWLIALGMMYIVRDEWGKLKSFAESRLPKAQT